MSGGGPPLRVAMDARSLSSPVLRGWDRYTIGLSRALVKQGVQVTWLCRAREPVHVPHAQAAGVRVQALADLGGLWWEQVSLPREIRNHDLYHAPAEHGVPLFSPRPVVLTIHSMTAHSYLELIHSDKLEGTIDQYLGYHAEPYTATFANSYWNAQARRANAILAPSDFARDEIVGLGRRIGIKAPRVSTTRLAVDDVFRGPPTPPDELAGVLARLGVRRPYLLYVGGYEPHKNVRGLLAMLPYLRELRPDLQLVLVGSRPPAPALMAETTARKLLAGRDVVFLDGLGPELPPLYDGAELFVSLSWRESFGLPALEAMTRSIAVVASEWGAAREILGRGALLVDPRDHQAFARAVDTLLHDRTRGERARAAAASFTWERTAEQTLAVYRSLLAS